MLILSNFKLGDRIELISGRFGHVVEIGRATIRIQMDRSGAMIRVRPESVAAIYCLNAIRFSD